MEVKVKTNKRVILDAEEMDSLEDSSYISELVKQLSEDSSYILEELVKQLSEGNSINISDIYKNHNFSIITGRRLKEIPELLIDIKLESITIEEDE